MATLTALPRSYTPDIDAECQYTLNRRPPRNQAEGTFVGGEDAALSHLNSYLFEWKVAASYKETRNALDNWRDSTKLSPWLATGALSARYVIQEVKKYEQNVVKNDSTYWIYFELLWREYFYWLQQKFGSKWFQLEGIKSNYPILVTTLKYLSDGATDKPDTLLWMRVCVNWLLRGTYLIEVDNWWQVVW